MTICRRAFLALSAAVTAPLLPSCSMFKRPDESAAGPAVSRVAFGSCAVQNRPQPIWEPLVAGRPQVYLALGDNIYGDTTDMSVMEGKYALLAAQPGYQKLKETCPVIATWDDHDYGLNDGGFEFAAKDESQRRFLGFFNEPADSPRWKRGGVYHSWMLGPSGSRIQVVMLDTRYHRTPLKAQPKEDRRKGIGPYLQEDSRDASMLGAAQWKWLEGELRKPADLRIIGSSVQLLPAEHQWEGWRTFPNERRRMIELLGSTNGCVVISGDRHHGEISRLSKAPYPLFDVTSSGINQTSDNSAELNEHRLGPIYCSYNYGTIDVAWNTGAVTLAVHDVTGKVVSRQVADLNKLRPRGT